MAELHYEEHYELPPLFKIDKTGMSTPPVAVILMRSTPSL